MEEKIIIDGIELSEYFKYHPPTTEDRKAKHEAVNDAALKFAEVIFANCKNPAMQKLAFQTIQQARMFANQGVTLDELTSS